MAKRRTIDITAFTKKINELLAESRTDSEHRRGVQTVLEEILHSTGTYRGYRYLTKNEVPAGELPGINISPIDGQHLEDFDARFLGTDRTRVAYFL